MANELRRTALRLLARREYTRTELARKLMACGTAEEVAALLAELDAAKLQSDRRVAESYVRSHAARLGAARLRRDLETRGVRRELIDAELAPSVLPDEMERARSLWIRKFSAPPADAREWARQARFLRSRGFCSETVRRLLKAPAGAPDE